MSNSHRVSLEADTPHYSTLLLFVGAATLATWPAYNYGDQYVKDNYVVDDPFAAMFGGYPAMVVVFGLVLQFSVDLMRLPVMQRLDSVLAAGDQLAQRALQRGIARLRSAQEDDSHYARLPATPAIDRAAVNIVSPSRSELAKRVALRVLTYGQVAATGMSSSLLPIMLMYSGEDIVSPSADFTCRLGACAVAGLQVNAMFNAYRQNTPRIRALAEDEDSDVESSEPVQDASPSAPSI